MDTDNNVVKAEVGNRTWWKWRKVEKCWTSVIVSTINILQKEATFLELPKLIWIKNVSRLNLYIAMLPVLIFHKFAPTRSIWLCGLCCHKGLDHANGFVMTPRYLNFHVMVYFWKRVKWSMVPWTHFRRCHNYHLDTEKTLCNQKKLLPYFLRTIKMPYI